MRSDIKMFSFCILVLLIIVFSGVSIKSYLNKTTSRFNSQITEIKQSIEKNDWNHAQKDINLLSKDWDSSQDKWALFINHHEIDNITISLLKAAQFIDQNDRSNSAAYLAELKEYIDHIPDMEKISLKNIL